MSSLLGTKYCIESLLQDVADVQETVVEVCSRVGQTNYQSWKFPDKLSCDVDVNELLCSYQYEKDDNEQNEVTHVMLYDLLIDRLLFLLQCFTHFNEVLLDPGRGKPRSKSASAGFTAKRCWSRLSQVAVSMQQLARLAQKTAEVKDEERWLAAKPSDPPAVDRRDLQDHPMQDFAPKIASRDMSSQSCQTDETSYVSCEICSRTQACLYDVGRVLVKVCKSQSLPSSLEDYLTRHNALLSVAELTRWKNLQAKDLSRVERQIESLMKQINPLKRDLAESKKEVHDARASLQHYDVITERRLSEMKEQFNESEYQFKESERVLQRKLSVLGQTNEKLREEIVAVHRELSEAKSESMEKLRLLRAADDEKLRLKEEADERRRLEVARLQSEVAEVLRKLEAVEQRLQKTELLLEKEQARNRTMTSHEQALQKKQEGLIGRLEDLSEECDELRERLAEADELKERLAEADELRDESRSQPTNNAQESRLEGELRAEVGSLEATIRELEEQLREHTERERLLVSYPDLHKSHGIQIIESTGDVCADMQRQVEANQLRINVLQKENEELRRTLGKFQRLSDTPQEQLTASIHSSQLHPSPREQENLPVPPKVQLWKSKRSDGIDLEFLGLSDTSSAVPNDVKNPLSSTNKQRRSRKEKRPDVVQISPTRTSFSVGPGKRGPATPSSSRPSSGRSALLKPWT